MNRSKAHDGRTDRRKSTLFCWECDHASPIDGDWLRQSQDGRVACICPVCETTIVEQPGESVSSGKVRSDERRTVSSQ
ncbi:hypothetical protein [Natronobacterium texcoconense]|uniref:DUF8106 domain-containing protein n=1 Tax=Natronobacterium texcoconense TaxID=1095778 RepID=A0A1H1FBM0_NATTX|nr:hypothetical protein [Natronobacterium texcoconense]SDQ98154.1 hypothetical protein SAMN04489842_1896 [Natronobacterium texcoconense]